ncbi:MAG: helix-turn-helix transcriptional regulator, partial [Acholeplasmataceae bacterium]|nr:helix-turn-helix transcriptional regulator [Acholeplasmataceae bacterium]
MSLKELRISKKLTQVQSAKYLGMPLRTYQNYENDESK